MGNKGRPKDSDEERDTKRQRTMKVFKLAALFERTMTGSTLTTARSRLEERLEIGNIFDGKAWQQYEYGKRNAGQKLVNTVSLEIYRLLSLDFDAADMPKDVRPFSEIHRDIWLAAANDENHLLDAFRTAEQYSYLLPEGLVKLKQALIDALSDKELIETLNGSLRDHRYHYTVIKELFDLFRQIVGYDMVKMITDTENKLDVNSRQ